MGECYKIGTCSFFSDRMKSMPSIAIYFKKRFCEGEYSGCARYYLHTYIAEKNYEVGSEREAKIADLSANLFPDELDRARTVLQDMDSRGA